MTAATTVMPTRDVTIGDTFVRISGQGFPLVFVHGFTTTSEFWREQAEEFSKAYRVIRINLPGHGASPAPTSRSYCLEDFVEDVARVFRELSIEKAVLIGLSMGGSSPKSSPSSIGTWSRRWSSWTRPPMGSARRRRPMPSLPSPTNGASRRQSRTCRTSHSVPRLRRRFSNGRDEKSFKPRNSSPGQRFARSMTPIRAALCPKSKCLRW
jgi:hypothetical protein